MIPDIKAKRPEGSRCVIFGGLPWMHYTGVLVTSRYAYQKASWLVPAWLPPILRPVPLTGAVSEDAAEETEAEIAHAA